MNSLQVFEFTSLLTLFLLSCSEGKAEIGNYIVDCSACDYPPLKGVGSYSCSVRCEAQGEVNMNLTGMLDMLNLLSEELETTKQRQLAVEKELNTTKSRQLETEKELNATKQELNVTREVLKIDVSFSAKLSTPGQVSYSAGARIIFTNEFSNIGNAYDKTTGIFTVPHDGTYQFMVFSVGTTGTQWAWITVNGERLSFSHGQSGFAQGGTAVNKKLVVGDQVWVESGESDTFAGEYTVFSGNIIHVDF